MNKQDRAIGVCLGASSVSFVKVAKKKDNIIIEDTWTFNHHGNPKQCFSDNLKEINKEQLPVVVTGRKFRNVVNLQTISEPEATEYAYEYLTAGKDDYSAIASLGGETFVVYTLEHGGKIAGVITKNQCASGTGEFFLQQIKRMDLSINEVIDIARDARPFKVSGRCSVFCKSDCTHALNKGVPAAEVASGLSQMMADKVRELLKKVKKGKVLLVGGVTQNSAVMDFLHKSGEDVVVPKEAIYFEALGAAVYGINHEIKDFESFDSVLKEQSSSFVFHKPLSDFVEKVTLRRWTRAKQKMEMNVFSVSMLAQRLQKQ
jgi:activator of 2-hydroxyglutaryl-CoA dehydratase